MPRPCKQRCCRRYDADRVYKPRGVLMHELNTTRLALDQFEALRLCDLEGLDQTAAGARMGVSRGTVQRLLKSARRELVAAILHGDALLVALAPREE
ncbi:MAG: DUF134 domain-containing protein [Candidatus Latescibacteria bacterium]|nr:DUF134 domain-containing protein [Candidatus Latescibacterota bacterium]